MDSSTIFLENLKCHFNVNSIRSLAEKLDYSWSIILNWSSGRSSPSIHQLNDIAYKLGVHVSELLIEKNTFTIQTPIWKDNVHNTLIQNLGVLRLECDIHESFFNQDINYIFGMSYRSFLRYINGKNKNLNLDTLDKLAKIFNTETYKLLESEDRI